MSVFDEPMYARYAPEPAAEKARRDIKNTERRRNGKLRCPDCGDWGLCHGEDTHGKYTRCCICKTVRSSD
jgi:hypothetical protein